MNMVERHICSQNAGPICTMFCILSRISNMNIQFWAVLGSRGCREKNSNCHKRHKYATFEVSFLCFHGQKKFKFF